MTEALFLNSQYLRDTGGVVKEITDEGGIVLDRTNFYATSGGQPGDSGSLAWDGGEIEIATTVKRCSAQPYGERKLEAK